MSEKNDNIINIIFNPGNGRCDTRTTEAVTGERYPVLPIPKRKGYVFDGWYKNQDGSERVNETDSVLSETDITLYARWKKDAAYDNKSIRQKKKKGSLHRQTVAAIILAAVVVVLIAALVGANYIADIYTFKDSADGSEYYIRKVDGNFVLTYKNGNVCQLSEDGKYYVTDAGTMVKVDKSEGTAEIYAIVETEGTETLGFSDRILLFKQLTYDASSTNDTSRIIKSIEIHNEYGTYTLKKYSDTSSRFYIEGYQQLVMEDMTVAQLANACGYTLSTMRLENPKLTDDGKIDYAEYGLESEIRQRVVIDDDGNETVEEYEYEPAWYIISTVNGDSYKVYVGDATVTGNTYYVRYGNRDKVYIISGVGEVIKRLEDLVTPMIVYPMSSTTYFDVSDFEIITGIDYESIKSEWVAWVLDNYGEDVSDKEAEIKFFEKYKDNKEELLKLAEKYNEIYDSHSNKICHFSFWDLDERTDTMYSSMPYISHLEYSNGYYINSDTVSNMLYKLTSMQFNQLIKIAPNEEDLKEYGLYEPEYVISYVFNTVDSDNEKLAIDNYFSVSKQNKDGTYYAYSDDYDMLVCIDEQYLDFLGYSEVQWYDPKYVQLDISYVSDIFIESPSFSGHYIFENSASKFGNYMAIYDTEYKDSKGNVYTVEFDSNTGKYVLMCDGKVADVAYSGDYLLTGQAYKKGTNNEEYGYSFAESKGIDSNDDGYYDYFLYYYYIVQKSQGKYVLTSTVAKVSLDGKVMDKSSSVCEGVYETEYFITKSGYIFLVSKDSAIGKQLTEKYEKVNRGYWGEGDVYISNGKKKVLVDSKTGEWYTLSNGYTSSFFRGDKYESYLNRLAAVTKDVILSDGSVRNSEIFYPLSDKRIRYNEETTKIEVYNSNTGTWSNATYDDCTLGFWSTGVTYLTKDGKLLMLDSETGHLGYIEVASSGSSNAIVFFENESTPKKQLDYTIQITTPSGKLQTQNATYNFRQLYKTMLIGSLEGMTELTPQQTEAFRNMSDEMFSTPSDNNPCVLKMTVLATDAHGNQRNLVYRFYRYTERRAYITIEVIGDDITESSPNKAYGTFYVLNSYAEKIISDAQKVVEGIAVNSSDKY